MLLFSASKTSKILQTQRSYPSKVVPGSLPALQILQFLQSKCFRQSAVGRPTHRQKHTHKAQHRNHKSQRSGVHFNAISFSTQNIQNIRNTAFLPVQGALLERLWCSLLVALGLEDCCFPFGKLQFLAAEPHLCMKLSFDVLAFPQRSGEESKSDLTMNKT